MRCRSARGPEPWQRVFEGDYLYGPHVKASSDGGAIVLGSFQVSIDFGDGPLAPGDTNFGTGTFLAFFQGTDGTTRWSMVTAPS